MPPQSLNKPFAVTMGDPAGIGPDITILAWLERHLADVPAFFVAGDAQVLADRAKMLKGAGAISIEAIAHPADAEAVFRKALPVLSLGRRSSPVAPGEPDAVHAPAIIASIEQAVELAVAGQAAGVVTNPIAKYVLLESGFAHAGHTEFLAELAGRHAKTAFHPVMLLASKRLMAVPVTVHIALKDVPAAITKDRIVRIAATTASSLTRFFGIARPRLAICGLNPHAGENGALGLEEIEVIAPAIEALKANGIIATGPHSADTLFHDAARETYDAVLAMYHDQALIPFKTLSFDDGVNVTLGLPFIRTSPDHGTAFSLAGTGRANPASFMEALRVARSMASTAQTQAAAHP